MFLLNLLRNAKRNEQLTRLGKSAEQMMLLVGSTTAYKHDYTLGDARSTQDDIDEEIRGGFLQESPQEDIPSNDVFGDRVPKEKQESMQILCMEILRVPFKLECLVFPGSQPSSLTRKHLQLLQERYYCATWKADGLRYMMLLMHDGCYMIDRNFQFQRLEMRFPRKNFEGGGNAQTQHLTLIDGEMIIDIDARSGAQKRSYLVYDLMMLNGQSLVNKPFSERWKAIERELIEPRKQDALSSHQYNYELEAVQYFQIKRKGFWVLPMTQRILGGLIQRLPHKADGVIFQGWDDPYIPYGYNGLLKWKYPHMNSVDFILRTIPELREQRLCLLGKTGELKCLDGAKLTLSENISSKALEGKVVECSWNIIKNSWEFMRVRNDKKHPNTWTTYRKIVKSIEDNITEDVLYEEIGKIVQLPMYGIRTERSPVTLKQDPSYFFN